MAFKLPAAALKHNDLLKKSGSLQKGMAEIQVSGLCSGSKCYY